MASYSNDDGTTQFTGGEPLAAEIAEQLRAIAERARRSPGISAKEILTEVAEVSPEIAAKLQARWPLPAFVLIILLIWIVKSISMDVKIDLNHLIDQAYHIFRGEDPESHLDTPPPPRWEAQEGPTALAPPILAGLGLGTAKRQRLRQLQRQARRKRRKS